MPTNRHGQPVGDPVPGWAPRSMPARVRLRGRHVSGEPVHTAHTPALYAALCGPGDDPLWTYRATERPRSPEELEQSVVSVLAGHPESVSFAFVPTGAAPAGIATFYPCVPGSGVVEISGVLWSRSLQRTAAATEAVHLMLVHAFDDLGYRRVEWKCDTLNAPSAAAATRLGFTFEGRFRQHLVVQGRNRDTDWFSILDTEWPALRARQERWLDPANFDDDGRQRRRLADA